MRLRKTTDSHSTSARISLPIVAVKLVAIAGIQHIAITARYEPHVSRGTSLSWIAPELRGARLALVGDHLSDPMPSRTWAGVVDEQTFARFAKSWGLQRGNNGDSASELDDDTDNTPYTQTYDGMNWELGGKSPIISVSVEVEPAPADTTSPPTSPNHLSG